MAHLTLEPITQDNVEAILALRTTEEQRRFVAPNDRSLAQGSVAPFAYARGIYADGTPVGFVMLDIGTDPGRVWVWRLMVDHRHQGRGHGRAALQQVIALARDWGATEVRLSYVPEVGNPGPFYLSMGFTETGEEEDGERVMALALGGDGARTLRTTAAARYGGVALVLERAAGHARVAAGHLRNDRVPEAAAHALATRGEILEATGELDDLAKLHASRSRPGAPAAEEK